VGFPVLSGPQRLPVIGSFDPCHMRQPHLLKLAAAR
jgi:hypothetical protein